MNTRPAVFFDRDGIVNQSPGPGYVNRLEDFHILPGFLQCLRVLARKQIPAVVVTNQRGVSRSITPAAELEKMHNFLRDTLQQEGLALLDIRVCTSGDQTHPNRKPNPGMLLEAAGIHGLDLSRSWMIGDRESDVMTGQRAHVNTTVLVSESDTETAATFHVKNMEACADLLNTHL